MSNGYTIALAMTAPVAPATANPHGGIASFVPAILCLIESLQIPVKPGRAILLVGRTMSQRKICLSKKKNYLQSLFVNYTVFRKIYKTDGNSRYQVHAMFSKKDVV